MCREGSIDHVENLLLLCTIQGPLKSRKRLQKILESRRKTTGDVLYEPYSSSRSHCSCGGHNAALHSTLQHSTFNNLAFCSSSVPLLREMSMSILHGKYLVCRNNYPISRQSTSVVDNATHFSNITGQLVV